MRWRIVMVLVLSALAFELPAQALPSASSDLDKLIADRIEQAAIVGMAAAIPACQR